MPSVHAWQQQAAHSILPNIWHAAAQVAAHTGLKMLIGASAGAARLHGSEEWLQGRVTDSILATLGDYLSDYETYIDAGFYKRCAACAALGSGL